MKKRTVAIFIAILLLLQLLPMSAFAVTNYNLYVGGKQFTSSNLKYTFGSGTATYDPVNKYLTLDNATIPVSSTNAGVWSEISGLVIIIKGTVNINITRTGALNGSSTPFYGMMFNITSGYTYIFKDDTGGTLNINSKNSYSTVTGSNFSCFGLYSKKNSILGIINIKLNITDNSDSAYAGKMMGIYSSGVLGMGNVDFTAKKVNCAVFADSNIDLDNDGKQDLVSFSLSSVKINAECTSVGLAVYGGELENIITDLYGTITAPVGILNLGKLKISKDSSNEYLNINSSDVGIECSDGIITQNKALLKITAKKAIVLKNSKLEINGGDTVLSFTEWGIVGNDENSKIVIFNGTVTLTGNSNASAGMDCQGGYCQRNGTVTVSNVKNGIQTYSKDFEITGGSLTVTAEQVGYVNADKANLLVSIDAKATFTARIGIQLSENSGGGFTLQTLGSVTINARKYGLSVLSGAGETKFITGNLNINIDENTTENEPIGIYDKGGFTLTGAVITIKGKTSVDVYLDNGKTSVKYGSLIMSSPTLGMQIYQGFSMSNGLIKYQGSGVGLYCTEGEYNFSGGEVNIKSDKYPIEMMKGATLNISGAYLYLQGTKASCALYLDENSTYKVTGGSVYMLSDTSASNKMPSSVVSGHIAVAGATADSSEYIASPTASTYTNNKYVEIRKLSSVTLTLENVKDLSEYKANTGEQISFTAEEAPANKHFAYWNMTVGGETKKVGTNATYTGTMPARDATLTAVYETCTVNTAWEYDNTNHWNECSVCHRKNYLGKHIFELNHGEESSVVVPGANRRNCLICGCKEVIMPTSIDIAPKQLALKSGDSKKVFVMPIPLGCDNVAIEWTSNNTLVATVSDGTVTAVGKGTATITATTENGLTASCLVIVDCEHTDYSVVNKVDSTCGKEGYTGDILCNICKQTVSYGETSPATGKHTWNDGEVTKQPTCSDGEKTYTCTVCNKTKTESIDAISEHTWNSGEVTQNATCKDAGEKTFTCTVCGATKTEAIAKLTTHTYDSGKVTTAATCKDAGEKTFTCTVCGATKTETIAKLTTHTYNSGKVTTAATCKDAGEKTYTCTVCGATKTEAIEKLTTHTYNSGKVTTAATCKDAGEKTFTCTVCGATKTEAIAKLTTHTYDSGKVTTVATCKDAGEKTFTCTVCGATKTETIAKLTTHTYNSGKITKSATCAAEGIKTYTCTVCGATKTETIAKLTTHTYDSGKVTTAATCKNAGEKTFTCTVCGATKTEAITKLTTHTYNSGKVTTAPTCKDAGEKTYTCTVCKSTKTETIAKVAHTYKTVTTVATLTKDGKIQSKCSVCGNVKSTTAIAKIKTVSLSKTSATYTGKAIKPTVTVKDSKGKTVDSKYYTVTYKNNTNVGKATVTVKFKGNYSGTKTLTFKINPKATTVSKATSTKKGTATVTVKKQATQTTGYEIQYSTSSKFTASTTKTVKITSASTLSKTISKLTSGKTYYFRVRTYKTVSKVDYTSAWSTSVKAKIK